MGRRGPKPQPTALKLERGNPGRRPLNAVEPELAPPSDDATAPPKGLPVAAVAEWNAQIGELLAKGVLTSADMTQFRQYCWMYAEVCSLEDKLAKMSAWSDRQLKMSAHLSKLHARLTQQAAHFGITPSSRSGVKTVPVVPKKDAAAVKHERFFGTGAS